MEGYVRGGVAAFGALFARHQGRAYAFFARRLRSDHRAEDLYQVERRVLVGNELEGRPYADLAAEL